MENILDWFNNCDDEIILKRSNKKNGYIGILFNGTLDAYEAFGENETEVLFKLKSMLDKKYYI